MESTKRLNNLKVTLILTTITLVSWVIFSIYQALYKPLPAVVPPEILEPLEPKLDNKTLETLQQRFYIDEGQISKVKLQPENEPEPPSQP